MLLNKNLEDLSINGKLLGKNCYFPEWAKKYFIRICRLLKGRLSTSYFLDCFDGHFGCCGGHSNRCDWVWIAKVLPDLVTFVGGSKNDF